MNDNSSTSGNDQADSAPVTGQLIEQMLEQLKVACQQRDQLSEIESELSRRIEKLNGQRKSLSRRFRKEWQELKAAKQEIQAERERVDSCSGSETFQDQTRQLAQSCTLVPVVTQNSEQQQRDNESPDDQGRFSAELDDNRTEEMFELKRELERALSELNEVKAENSRLRSSSKSSAINSSAISTSAIEVPQGSNWEEMKQALIDGLEDESADNAPDPEELIAAVKESQHLIQQKDEIIRRLESIVKANRRAAAAEQREAKRKILDEDEVVGKELARLSELQQQWRDKIGQAEVELAQERAKLARDRTELDEQIEEFEELQDAVDYPQAPRGHKWREHLGLE